MSKKIVGLIGAFFLVLLIAQATGWGSQIKLSVQTYWPENTSLGQALLEMIGDYEKENPGVDIDHIEVPFGQLNDKIMLQTMTESLPEIVFDENGGVLGHVEAGSFLDITTLIEEWGQWEDFYPGSRDVVTVDGRIYAIHMVTNNLCLFYNTDMLSEAGLVSPPETWAELVSYAGKLTKGNRYGIAFSAPKTEELTWQFVPFLWTNRGSLFALDKAEAIEALELWVTLLEKGYASRDVVNWGQGDLTIQFNNDLTAMMIMGCWDIPQVRGGGNKFGIAKLPVPQKGMNPIVSMGGECFGVSPFVSQEKQQAAWYFIRWLAEPEQSVKLNLLLNMVPTRKSAAPIVLEREPILKPFLDQLEHAVTRSVAGGGGKYYQVSAIVRTAVQRALIGETTPDKAFQEAAKKIEELMAT